MIGIYRIRNIVNNKCYYGSSKEIKNRWNRHIKDLNNNSHYNTILQRAWNKYGEEYFIFEIVEKCKQEDLFLIEQKYLNTNPEYNIGTFASGGDNISRNPNKEKVIENIKNGSKKWMDSLSDCDRKEKFSKPLNKNPNWKGGISIAHCKICGIKISANCKYCREHVIYDRSKEKNAFYGKKHSEEVKKLISEKNKGRKPPNMKQVMIDGIVYESLCEASKKTGIPSPTILWRINSKNKKFIHYRYF
jgi:group I intron endonuclease